ncbi:MAG: rane protein [Mycobacterium sp.]|nr:rane protein [Mycobacterium sp.]
MTIERPTARYGRQKLSRRTRRRVVIGLFLLIVTAGVVIALIAFQRFGTGDVKGELGGYKIVDDETVAVTITVTRSDPSVPAVCIVRARSINGDETGRREILVPPSTATSVVIDAVVKSTKPPVVGDIYGCGIDVPPYLVAP